MIVQILIIALLITLLAIKDIKIRKLQQQLEIRKSENLSLKRILAENNLIPKKFVK